MREVYLDHAAATPVTRDALSAYLSATENMWANPSSLHKPGFKAEQMMTVSRKFIADALGGKPEELIFTPSGTFADNLAIIGTAHRLANKGKHIIVSAIEHEAVLRAVESLVDEGFDVTRVKPGPDGRINAGTLLGSLRSDTILVSCMLVNNELGTLQPIKEISHGLKLLKNDVILHTDAVQAFKKVPFSVNDLGADLVSISGHKIGAPRGIGALWIKSGTKINPLTFGGGQESGLCPGTESVPLIAAFAKASMARMPLDYINGLCDKAVSMLSEVPGLKIISRGDAPIINFAIPGYKSETMLNYLSARGIYVSAGSACGKGKPSHVLTALGLDRELIEGSLRISFNSSNSIDEIAILRDVLCQAVAELAHV